VRTYQTISTRPGYERGREAVAGTSSTGSILHPRFIVALFGVTNTLLEAVYCLGTTGRGEGTDSMASSSLDLHGRHLVRESGNRSRPAGACAAYTLRQVRTHRCPHPGTYLSLLISKAVPFKQTGSKLVQRRHRLFLQQPPTSYQKGNLRVDASKRDRTASRIQGREHKASGMRRHSKVLGPRSCRPSPVPARPVEFTCNFFGSNPGTRRPGARRELLRDLRGRG
jgi:hypothetical protein